RTWQATDACGNSSQCSQKVTIVDTTAPVIDCSASPNKTVQQGTAWTFDPPTATDNSGGNVITIVSTVTNTSGHCGTTFDATRTWQATDACGNSSQCSQKVTIVDTTPPTVTITSPTNGTIFIAPASFTVLAEAHDPDGVIAKVEFFANASKVGEATNGEPYFIVLTNVQAGNHTLVAIAIDGCGLAATSAPVSITVLERPPLSFVSEIHFNPQTGLYEQTVRVSNPTYSTFDAVRLYVYGLTNNTTVYNASGNTNGVPFIESHTAVAPGSYIDLLIEYYVPSDIIPDPTLLAALVPPPEGGGAVAQGVGQHINRGFMRPDQTFLVEFASVSNRVYSVQYTSDLKEWKAVQPAITGNGTWIQWIDNGQPKTDSAPATQKQRFYRVILLP
ncbi:MAG: HYR domain-containing protein, partial [Verrucomicrobia bacterium]|nr:HYR domain-containing protein [Verrucomicrobiota bacterium]